MMRIVSFCLALGLACAPAPAWADHHGGGGGGGGSGQASRRMLLSIISAPLIGLGLSSTLGKVRPARGVGALGKSGSTDGSCGFGRQARGTPCSRT